MADAVEKSVTPEAPATRSLDDPKIVDAVQAHLDAFAGLEAPTIPEVETPVTEDAPEAGATPVTETTKPSQEPAEVSPAEPVKEAAAAPAPTLPVAYIRSAKARGWTDEEIQSAVDLNPDKALQTFERMHTSRSQEISEWAELGRKVRSQTPAASATPPASVNATPVSAAPAPSVLRPINVQEMVEKFGNQELIEALAGPVNAAIQALTPIMERAKASETRAKQTAQEQLGKVVQDFFTDKSMAPYAESYGGDIAKLTETQVEMRGKVLEMADALIAGATFQGRKLSVQEALTLAHDTVSAPVKESVIRDQIRQSVKKRAAGITLRPTGQGRDDPGAKPRDRSELMTRTEGRLAKALG
jgi:hypothetical protein